MFNSYAAGLKSYGTRGAPNIGPVADKTGYVKRDMEVRAKRNALLKRIKAGQAGKYGSANYNRVLT